MDKVITRVFASSEIKGICRKSSAWRTLIDFIDIPGRIPTVDAIRIIEKDNRSMLSEWFMSLDGAPFSWIERDTFFPEQHSYQFEAVSGDFDIYRGCWKITENGSGINVVASEIEYSLGIPVIEENLGEVLKEKMQQYLNTLVKNQCQFIDASTHDTRHSERINVNCHAILRFDGRNADAQVINLSCGGMMFRLMKGMFEADEHKERSIDISNITLKGFLCFDPEQSVHRFIFSDALSITVVEQICQYWKILNTMLETDMTICEVVTGKHSFRPIHS